MRRLLFILSFVICPLSFSFAQQSGYQMVGPYAVVARNGQYASSKDGSERDMWQAWQRARQGDMSTAITIINAYTGTLQRLRRKSLSRAKLLAVFTLVISAS